MGFTLSKFLKIAEVVVPLALSGCGLPPELIPIIVHAIQLAESAGEPRNGADKKALAMEIAQTAIEGVNAVQPGKVDPNILTVVSDGIDLAVKTINAAKRLQTR